MGLIDKLRGESIGLTGCVIGLVRSIDGCIGFIGFIGFIGRRGAGRP
ncbi:hypothetical protein AB0O34_22380 [Sphaerisporangium sp. NPDC088356]